VSPAFLIRVEILRMTTEQRVTRRKVRISMRKSRL